MVISRTSEWTIRHVGATLAVALEDQGTVLQ